MESVSAQGTQRPRRGAGASRFAHGGHDGHAREVEGELGRDARARRRPARPAPGGSRSPRDTRRPATLNGLLGDLDPEGREAVARREQASWPVSLSRKTGPAPDGRLAGARRLAGERERRALHRGVGDGPRLEAVVGGKRPRDVVVGLAAVLGELLGREQVHRVVAVGLVEAHDVAALGEVALLEAQRASIARLTSMRWSQKARPSAPRGERSPWSSGITKA